MKKVIDAEVSLQEDKPAVTPTPEPAPEVTHRYVKTDMAFNPTVLPDKTVIKWAREKRPDGRITRWGKFETTDSKLAAQLDKLVGEGYHIHKI